MYVCMHVCLWLCVCVCVVCMCAVCSTSVQKPSSASLEEPLPEEVLRILLSAGHHNRPGPLAGMLVVDLSHTVAGPFCGRLLGEYGATVIKIDPIGVNYMVRRTYPHPSDTHHTHTQSHTHTYTDRTHQKTA